MMSTFLGPHSRHHAAVRGDRPGRAGAGPEQPLFRDARATSVAGLATVYPWEGSLAELLEDEALATMWVDDLNEGVVSFVGRLETDRLSRTSGTQNLVGFEPG